MLLFSLLESASLEETVLVLGVPVRTGGSALEAPTGSSLSWSSLGSEELAPRLRLFGLRELDDDDEAEVVGGEIVGEMEGASLCSASLAL